MATEPIDNQSTIFLFIIGLLMSLFVMVGNFGPIGFLPFGLIIGGFAIQQKLKVHTKTVSTSGFSVKTLTWIAAGLVLVLTINYLLGTVLSVAFLQPPISASAYAASAQYGNLPIYVYTLLFAISEEYLFREVLLYWIYNSVVFQGLMKQFAAVGGSAAAWMIFHLFVYGSQPFVLVFIFFTGIIFGFATLYSKSILVSSTIHGVNNLLAAGLTIARLA